MQHTHLCSRTSQPGLVLASYALSSTMNASVGLAVGRYALACEESVHRHLSHEPARGLVRALRPCVCVPPPYSITSAGTPSVARSAASLLQPHRPQRARGLEPFRSGRFAALTGCQGVRPTHERCFLAGRADCGAATMNKLETGFLAHFRRFCPILVHNNPSRRGARSLCVLWRKVYRPYLPYGLRYPLHVRSQTKVAKRWRTTGGK